MPCCFPRRSRAVSEAGWRKLSWHDPTSRLIGCMPPERARREHLDVGSAAASPVHVEVAPGIRAAGARPGPAVRLLSMQQPRLCLEQACLKHSDSALLGSRQRCVSETGLVRGGSRGRRSGYAPVEVDSWLSG